MKSSILSVDTILLIAIGENPNYIKKQQTPSNNADDKDDISFGLTKQPETTVPSDHYKQILDHVFHSMVLTTGLDELTNIKNIERLKKDLRASYKLIDVFLNQGILLKIQICILSEKSRKMSSFFQ